VAVAACMAAPRRLACGARVTHSPRSARCDVVTPLDIEHDFKEVDDTLVRPEVWGARTVISHLFTLPIRIPRHQPIPAAFAEVEYLAL
jgi:hypothetical protein